MITKLNQLYQNLSVRLTVLYLIIGGVYIFLSDALLTQFIRDPTVLTTYQTYKGWVFILVTGIILFFLIRWHRQEIIQREHDVWESKQHFHGIAEQTEDIIYRYQIQPDHEMTYISPAIEAVAGFSPEQIYTNPGFIFDQIHPDDEETLLERLTNPETVRDRIELRWFTQSGDLIWVEHSGGPLYNPEGEFIAVHGIARDVTAAKEREQALRESERQFREIFENIHEGFFRSTPEGKILLVNPQFAEMFGFESPEALIGNHYEDFSCFDTYPQDEFLAAIQQNDAVTGFESALQTQAGDDIIVWENTRVVRDMSGDVQYYEGTVDDITDKRMLEQQLIQSQKMESLGQIAGGIAHDFNNVLATIAGAMQLIQLQTESEKASQYFEMVDSAIIRGETVTDRLLTFTRSASPMAEPLSLQSFLNDVQQIANHTLPTAVSITVDAYHGPDLAYVEKGQLQQVLMNMCINASDAMEGHGTITLGLRAATDEELETNVPEAESDYLCLVVSDTGTGMDSATQQRIFEPFFTTKRHGEGTGLGLAVANKIILNHNGWIDVDSEPGKGTTFTLGLPLVENVTISDSTEVTAQEYSGQGEQIYIVEDESSIRQVLRDHLESRGYQVRLAKNGTEAIQHFKQSSTPAVDIVITDLGLPDMSGEEVAQTIMASNPTLPIIALTGYVDEDKHQSLRNMGFQTVLKKPFDLHTVSQTIAEILLSKE